MSSALYDITYTTADEFFRTHPEITADTDHGLLTDLLNGAISNKDIPSRRILVTRLLEWGADATRVGARDRTTILHTFAWFLKDPAVEAPVLKRLLDAGADPNQWSPRQGWALEYLMDLPRFGDADLAAVYDVWFAHPGLDFATRHGGLAHGDSLWDKVWRKRGNKPDLVSRTERYIARHTGGPPPTPQYAQRQPDKSWLRFEHGQTIQKGESGFWYVVADAPTT